MINMQKSVLNKPFWMGRSSSLSNTLDKNPEKGNSFDPSFHKTRDQQFKGNLIHNKIKSLRQTQHRGSMQNPPLPEAPNSSKN
jgi:hypothetical protein